MKKRTKYIAIAIVIVLNAGIAALLISEYLKTGKIESESALRALAVCASSIIMYAKLYLRERGGNTLRYKQYEEIYGEYIKNAFTRSEDKKYRRALLSAIDYYNNDNYSKALEILEKLKKKCAKQSDSFAVNMFDALCYSDMGLNQKAIDSYKAILSFDPKSSTVWSNIGLLYVKEGKNTEAEEAYKKAIELNGENPYPYNNLGTLYLKELRYDEAIEAALAALERKNNMYQASNTLAIAYTLNGEFDLADKYFKISVANGVDAEGLRSTIDRYCEELD